LGWIASLLTDFAQPFSIDWHQIGGAGGVSTGGAFSLAGAIEQPTAEHSISGSFTIDAGFIAAPPPNRAPIATLDIVTRGASENFKIEINRLLANDVDPDLDPFTISFPSFTANGVPLTVQGGWIYYSHIDDQPDSFVYTIADANGATAQATVSIQVGVRDSQFTTFLQITAEDPGARIFFFGIPNRVYIVQYRDTLNDPWQDSGSATDLSLGRYQFDDATGSGTRFYRVVYRE
jgi:hypothetical protein